MIAWGTAEKACELARYLDQEDTVIPLRFPTLSLGKKLQDAIAQTAEDYLSQHADPEARRGPKRVKHEHMDEVLPGNPYPERAFVRDGLYKHDSPSDDSKPNLDPVSDEPLDRDATQEATKQLEDQQEAQEDAPRKNEQPGGQRPAQDNAIQEVINQHKVDQPAHHATSAGEDTVPRRPRKKTRSYAPTSPPPPGVTREAWDGVRRFYQAALNAKNHGSFER